MAKAGVGVTAVPLLDFEVLAGVGVGFRFLFRRFWRGSLKQISAVVVGFEILKGFTNKRIVKVYKLKGEGEGEGWGGRWTTEWWRMKAWS